jgi:hypothetical protein
MRITFVLFIAVFVCSCGQNNSGIAADGYTLDPSIKEEVEEHTSSMPFGGGMVVCNNASYFTVYENDKVTAKTDGEQQPFKSFYYWNKNGDTLHIDGAYGLFGGFGFTIQVVKGKASVYHLLASDEFPSYSYNEKDSLIFRLEVPCTDSQIVLSEIPDSVKKPIIYGFVEFKSKEYFFSEGTMNDEEILPRKKQRMDMKIYFKSGYVGF